MRKPFILLLVATACTALTEPNYGERFSPPPSYQQLWKAMESCSGLRGDFYQIEWFHAPSDVIGEKVSGRWWAPHTIVLSEFTYTANIVTTIQHEMLHDLLQAGGHPAVFDICHVR